MKPNGLKHARLLNERGSLNASLYAFGKISITDNWVLVYHKTGNDTLVLHATGTHADVFG